MNIKYTRLLKKVYKEENILSNLTKLFNQSEFKIDWVGRIYVVLNPNLIDRNEQIFEYDEKGINNKAFVDRWIMSKMLVVSSFIREKNLFDLLTYNIKRLDEYNNYLFVIKPITFDDFIKYTKYFCILCSAILLVLISILIFLN